MAESTPLKRLQFFTGQLLTADSFKLEQDYFRDKLKRHNRTLHGFGIISGLKVTVQSGRITVGPGLALDCEGNELLIPSAQTVVVDSPIGELSAAYVSVRYVEEETDFLPAVPDEPSTESSGAKASTITEGVAIEIVPENSNRGHRHSRARWLACGTSHPLTIAKLKRSLHGWRVERGYRPPSVK